MHCTGMQPRKTRAVLFRVMFIVIKLLMVFARIIPHCKQPVTVTQYPHTLSMHTVFI